MYDYIGERIRKVREFEGISQKNLGLTLGLSDKAISAYESGRTLPTIDTLFRISKELKKPFSYFVQEMEDEASLYERVDRVEKMTYELIQEIRALKVLMSSNPKTKTQVVPPNEPVVI